MPGKGAALNTAKQVLRGHCGLDVFPPRKVFRQLRTQDLLDKQATETALRMADASSRAIHMYEEEIAEKLYQKTKEEYFAVLEEIYNQMIGNK